MPIARESAKPIETAPEEPIVQLHPDFPIVEGNYQMTKLWSIDLPDTFNRRFEDGSLVIWKPGFTIWVSIWGNDENQTQNTQFEQIKAEVSEHGFDRTIEKSDGLLRYAYQLQERTDDERQPAFYGFVISEQGYVQIAFYFDSADDLATAQNIWRSISENGVD